MMIFTLKKRRKDIKKSLKSSVITFFGKKMRNDFIPQIYTPQQRRRREQPFSDFGDFVKNTPTILNAFPVA